MTTLTDLNAPFNDISIVSVTKLGSNFLTLSKSMKVANLPTNGVNNTNTVQVLLNFEIVGIYLDVVDKLLNTIIEANNLFSMESLENDETTGSSVDDYRIEPHHTKGTYLIITSLIEIQQKLMKVNQNVNVKEIQHNLATVVIIMQKCEYTVSEDIKEKITMPLSTNEIMKFYDGNSELFILPLEHIRKYAKSQQEVNFAIEKTRFDEVTAQNIMSAASMLTEKLDKPNYQIVNTKFKVPSIVVHDTQKKVIYIVNTYCTFMYDFTKLDMNIYFTKDTNKGATPNTDIAIMLGCMKQLTVINEQYIQAKIVPDEKTKVRYQRYVQLANKFVNTEKSMLGSYYNYPLINSNIGMLLLKDDKLVVTSDAYGQLQIIQIENNAIHAKYVAYIMKMLGIKKEAVVEIINGYLKAHDLRRKI